MSYYDRLQGAMGGMESSGSKHLNQLNEVKEKAQDQFSGASGMLSSVASNAMKGDLKIAGRHIGMAEAKHLGSKYIMKPLRARAKAKMETQQKGLSDETNEITTRGEGRLGADSANVEDAYKLADGSIVGAGARPSATSAQGTRVESGEALEGKVVPKGTGEADEEGNPTKAHPDDVLDKDTGLKVGEDARLGEITKSAKLIGDDSVGVVSKISKGLDFLGPVGELASLGVMLGEGIKTAVEAHKNSKSDISSESSSIQTGAQASMYAGMNRPSFGSMALPSFDTSKSSAMLQQ